MGNNNSQETERSHSLGNFENRLNVPVPDSTSTSESFILHQIAFERNNIRQRTD